MIYICIHICNIYIRVICSMSCSIIMWRIMVFLAVEWLFGWPRSRSTGRWLRRPRRRPSPSFCGARICWRLVHRHLVGYVFIYIYLYSYVCIFFMYISSKRMNVLHLPVIGVSLGAHALQGPFKRRLCIDVFAISVVVSRFNPLVSAYHV